MRFSLKSLLLVITLACVVLGFYLSQTMQRVRNQRYAVKQIEAADGSVNFDWPDDTSDMSAKEKQAPDWIVNLVGDEYFRRITTVTFPRRGKLCDDNLKCLARLPDLKFFQISMYPRNQSQVSDAGLAHLSSSRNLLWVNFRGNKKITGSGLSHLKRNRNLRQLYLRGSPVDDSGAANIACFTQLTDLMLTGTKITDRGLEHLSTLKNLECLDLQAAAITSEGIRHLSGLTNLKHLVLSNTQVDNRCIEYISKLSLESLYLRHTRIDDEGARLISEISTLRTLELSATPITSDGIAHFAKLDNLTGLGLVYTCVDEAALPTLAAMKSLKSLYLPLEFSDESREYLRRALPNDPFHEN